MALSEIVQIIPGYAFKGKHFGDTGALIVKIKDIKPPYINLSSAERVDLANYESKKLDKFKLIKGQAALAMTGATIGKIGILAEPEEVYVNQRVAKIASKDGFDYKFAIYSISGDDFQTFIQNNIDSNSAQENISAASIGRFTVLLPTPEEQHTIAEVLSSLDDKIDLLHRQNQTLEQMAETLFRQWFPANAGQVAEEADEGCEECTVADFAEHSKVTIKPGEHPYSVYAHYSIPGFDAGKEPIYEPGHEIRSNKYRVFENTILFSKLNPHKDKRVWLIIDEVPENAICSTEFQVIRPSNQNYLFFLYGWLTHSENYREISSGVGGTSGSHQRISPNEIFSFPTPIVSDEILKDYANSVKPIFRKQQSNQLQIRTLTDLRDSLLPKLMSGQVRVMN